MSGPFVYEMLFRGDASSAKAAAAEALAATNALSSATKNAATAAAAETTALGENTAAKARAAQATQAQAAAETAARSAMLQAQGVAQTAMQRSIASWAGIREASESATAAELRHGMALDEIRASYNPLFAASRQYEMQLRGIAEAERQGAITAAEAAAARTRAAASMAPIGPARGAQNPGGGANAFYSANLMAQWNDIAVMTAAGQNPMMLMMQQGTQVTQTFAAMRASGISLGAALRSSFMGMLNPMSLATMAVIAFGSAAVQWMMGAHGETKTLKERMSDLASATKEVESALQAAKMGGTDLFEQFGVGAKQARALNVALLDLAQIQAEQSLRQGLDKIGESIGDLASFGVTNISTLQKQFNLTERSAFTVAAAMQKFSAASTVDEQTKAAEALLDAFRRAEYGVGGASTKALDFAQSAGKAAIEALRIAGYSEQAARLQEQLAKGNISAPYISAADEAKRLADQTAKILRDTASASKMRDELQAQAKLQDAILRFGENSIEVKRLKIELERQDFEAQLASLTISEQQREVLRQQWELTKGLKSADPFGSLARGKDILRHQTESVAKLQLELGLIGETEAVRRRLLALFEAEQQIRLAGIDPASETAQQIRQGAAAASELEAQVARVEDAWGRVRGAGENAIDGIFEALHEGDIGGAFESILSEIGSLFEDLALKNPLKNAIFGTDYATWSDVGGFGGIWDRLTGKAGPLEVAGISSKSVGAMNVTAANVVINGGLGGIAGQLASAVGAGGGLAGSNDVQSQIWNFFSGKGLKAHQISAIMGNASAESGFNPLAVGDAGNAFGLFQWNDRKNNLFDFIGGQQNLGNIQGQLEFAWHELMTSEASSMQRLMSSGNLYDATKAFVGFERPSGYSPSNPTGSMHWDQRLAAAEAAMAKFGDTATAATANLGTLGNGAANLGSGLQSFGGSLAGMLQNVGASYGVGGSLAGSLLVSIGHAIGIPGFAIGGPTGGSDPSRVAGFVHEEEFVFDAPATRRIGVENLESLRRGGLRGYATGGYVSTGRLVPASAGGAAATQTAASATTEPRHVFEINVAGTGDREILSGVQAAIRSAFDTYDRDVFAGRVRMVMKDNWSS